ncbi:hypothetical protein BVH01_20845 [Pseudomonas sp. PA1(2017)]|nr:hypothetical protein [Pseudomonas sp. PA1(2017)]OLU12823.1 hypothetical protein BVH01_20845 [Pseudomonas sp. PA1(2017)]OLU27863.1 hypothetical protein BVH06_18060 [Pseudomonas sp. PA27(2017)]
MTDLEFVMTDKTPPASRQTATEQPAEPPILRDVVEPLVPRKPGQDAAHKTARPTDEPKQADEPEGDEQSQEFLDKYDLSQVEEERRERRWARR